MGLIGSTGPFPTTPPPPCVERCSPAPGQNTPECNGQTKARCQQMVQYENKSQLALRWKRRSKIVFSRAMFLNVSIVLLPTLETVVALAKALQRARQHYQGQ